MSQVAVSRYNERQVASQSRQTVVGLTMVAIALGLGYIASLAVIVP